jgi:hypothetical protein
MFGGMASRVPDAESSLTLRRQIAMFIRFRMDWEPASLDSSTVARRSSVCEPATPSSLKRHHEDPMRMGYAGRNSAKRSWATGESIQQNPATVACLNPEQ